MIYETMDLMAEARRIARAFGVEGPVSWFDHDDDIVFVLENKPSLVVSYNIEGNYKIFNFDNPLAIWSDDCTVIREDGSAIRNHPNSENDEVLACALFHLNLLTPEIEAALNISVTSHLKLEWTLEHKARMEGL